LLLERSTIWPFLPSFAGTPLLFFAGVLEKENTVVRASIQKVIKALIWFQTMIWSFVLVGAAGLSLYAWCETPQPWASIGQIWLMVGGLTVAVLAISLLLTGCSRLVRHFASPHPGKPAIQR